MQTSEKHAHTQKHHPLPTHTHTPHADRHTDLHSRLVCSFFPPLLSSCDRKDLDSELQVKHFVLATACHTHALSSDTNISVAVNTDTLRPYIKAHSYQGHRRKQPRQRHFVLNTCTKGEPTPRAYTDVAARTHTAAHKNFPQYAHPLSDRSRPQIEPICIFKGG